MTTPVKLPRLKCDGCYLSERCKSYKPGALCELDRDFVKMAEALNARTWEGLIEFLVGKLSLDSIKYVEGKMEGKELAKCILEEMADAVDYISVKAIYIPGRAEGREKNMLITTTVEMLPRDGEVERLGRFLTELGMKWVYEPIEEEAIVSVFRVEMEHTRYELGGM